MGKNPRRKQKRLAEKLLQIRLALGLSQNEILGYARLAGVCLDVIVDDELDLPAKLPARTKHRL
jgi:hypothetical protein